MLHSFPVKLYLSHEILKSFLRRFYKIDLFVLLNTQFFKRYIHRHFNDFIVINYKNDICKRLIKTSFDSYRQPSADQIKEIFTFFKFSN